MTKTNLRTDFVTYDYPQCINYSFLKIEPKELDHFENNTFSTNFSQDIEMYDKIEIFLKKIFLTTYSRLTTSELLV